MRHVYSSHAEVAHVWANNRHEVGHGRGFNVYFEGDTIYSYGRHFPIASFVTTPDGGEVVLFTTRSYSISTSKHISIVRRAIPPGYRVYHVSDPSSRSWSAMMRDALDSAGKFKAQAERRRSEWRRSDDLGAMQEQIAAARFCAYMDGTELPEDDEATLAEAERLHAEARERDRVDRERREEAQRLARARQEALWERAKPYWRDHVSPSDFPAEIIEEARTLGMGLSASGLSIAMRQSGDEIETSWGARFPIEHGIRAFRIMERIWAKGETWTRRDTGPRLGHYTVDEVTPEGVRAGCHFVPRAEVELMARTLNVADAPAPQLQQAR